MKGQEFLAVLDDLLEMERGTLTGAEKLGDIAEWDSMAVIGFIAVVDKHFGVTVDAGAIAKAKVVSDLVALVGEHIEP
jgi:acyl carrier protein